MRASLSRPVFPLKPTTSTSPLLHRHFSSTAATPPPPSEDDGNDTKKKQEDQEPRPSSFSPLNFTDLKNSLKQQTPNPQTRPDRPILPPLRTSGSLNPQPPKPSSSIASFDEIRKNLSEFRRRSAVPPPNELNSSPPNHISFREIYDRNFKSGVAVGSNEPKPDSGKLSFKAIRDSLRQMRLANNNNNMTNNNVAGMDRKIGDVMSISGFNNTLRLKPVGVNETEKPSTVIGGTGELPVSVFGKELKEGEKNAGKGGDAMSTKFVKTYSYIELGEQLRSLRPEGKEKDKKSREMSLLHELNERLRKLRELEVNKIESGMVGYSFKDLRDSLVKLTVSDEEKAKKGSSKYFHRIVPHVIQLNEMILNPM